MNWVVVICVLSLALVNGQTCSPGFVPSVAPGACRPCEVGRFSAGGTSVFCAACVEGTYSSVNGSSSCLSCTKGSEAPVQGLKACRPCRPGSFANTDGTAACPACAAGTYSAQEGKTTCTLCPVNFSTSNNFGQTSCIACTNGATAPNTGSPICSGGGTQSCPAGAIIPATGGCIPCQPGTVSATVNSQSCTPCAMGMFSPVPGQVSCLSCLAGQYSAILGAVQCTPCPQGSFVSTVGSTSCASCPAGQSTPGPGGVQCGTPPSGTPCPRGTYGTAGSCTPCAVGQFSPTENAQQCTNCPPGTFQANTGERSCTLCPAGTYNALAGAASCSGCPAQYSTSNLIGQSSCTACAAGTTAPNTGTPSCAGNGDGSNTCLAGTYKANPTENNCRPCQPGTFQPSASSTTCAFCPPGTFQPLQGAISCGICPGGTYSAVAGAPNCNICPAGSYAPILGSSSCVPCPSGNTAIAGSAACTTSGSGGRPQCPPGAFSTDGVTCGACPPGRFSGQASASVCTDCEINKSTRGQAGASACSACETGATAPTTGSAFCVKPNPSPTPTPGNVLPCSNTDRANCNYNNLPVCPDGTWPVPQGASNNCCPQAFSCRLNCTDAQIRSCGIDSLPVCPAGTLPVANGCCPSCRIAPPSITVLGKCTTDPSTLPACAPGASPALDANNCFNCRPPAGRIGNCTAANVQSCSDTGLPICTTVNVNRNFEIVVNPGEQSAQPCCLTCKPAFDLFCNDTSNAACTAAYPTLPICTSGQADFVLGRCCRVCRRDPNAAGNVIPPASGVCDPDALRNCFLKAPVCAAGEKPNSDTTKFCCPECRRPERTCAVEDVAQCRANIPQCKTGDKPAYVSGECCPTCIIPRPPCTCPTGQACVYGRGDGVAPTCAAIREFKFTIRPLASNKNALSAMTNDQLDALVKEIVQRFCDASVNEARCLRRAAQLRNSQISGEAVPDGSYVVTVRFPEVADETTGPGQILDRFTTMDTSDTAIYTDATNNQESGSGYATATVGGGSGASAVSATATLVIAAAAIAAIMPRFV